MKAVLAAAKEGDINAATLLLSRIWPARKGRPLRFELPDLTQPGSAAAALAAIARSTAEGILSAEEAGEIGKVVESYVRATDVVALVHRIEQLEATIAAVTAIFPHQPSAAIGAAVRRNGAAAG